MKPCFNTLKRRSTEARVPEAASPDFREARPRISGDPRPEMRKPLHRGLQPGLPRDLRAENAQHAALPTRRRRQTASSTSSRRRSSAAQPTPPSNPTPIFSLAPPSSTRPMGMATMMTVAIAAFFGKRRSGRGFRCVIMASPTHRYTKRTAGRRAKRARTLETGTRIYPPCDTLLATRSGLYFRGFDQKACRPSAISRTHWTGCIPLRPEWPTINTRSA